MSVSMWLDGVPPEALTTQRQYSQVEADHEHYQTRASLKGVKPLPYKSAVLAEVPIAYMACDMACLIEMSSIGDPAFLAMDGEVLDCIQAHFGQFVEDCESKGRDAALEDLKSRTHFVTVGNSDAHDHLAEAIQCDVADDVCFFKYLLWT